MSGLATIVEAVSRHFPGQTVGDWQCRAAARALLGRSTLLVAPEGSGRGLAWQIAAAAGRRPVLVVARSARGLDRRVEALGTSPGLVACRLAAESPTETLARLRDQLSAGRYDAALISARHLGDPRVAATARAMRPRLIVVEQAQALTILGRRFDPSLCRLPALLGDLARPPVMGLADLTPQAARGEIAGALDIPTEGVVLAEVDRPNLRLEVRHTPSRRQMDSHLGTLIQQCEGRAIVAVALRAEAERLAALIDEHYRVPACALGAGMAPDDFAAAMRRFREGSVRVVVATGGHFPEHGDPPVSLVVHCALPESLQALHRQAMAAGRDGRPARSVLLYDPGDIPRAERSAWRCAPEPGHLIAIHREIAQAPGDHLTYATLSRLTGLHPDEVHLAVEALVEVGAVRITARGDDWVAAEAVGAPEAAALHAFTCAADGLRRARIQQVEEVIEYARSRGCRRAALSDALGYQPAEDVEDCCDRCQPSTSALVPAPRVAYPIRAGDFRGWALDLYRLPGQQEPDDGPGRLLHDLKYAGLERFAERLAWLMARRVRERPELRAAEIIVPVPPTDPEAESSPATLLAEALGRLSDRPVAGALRSVRDRPPQKELTSGEEKRANVAGVFECVDDGEIDGRAVLLIDDLFDSGATLEEAGKVLRRAGATDVRLLTAVRTIFGWRGDT
ncbi:MAG: phosphoribosyltransferase family protein [Armatimonadota bacterium]